MDPYITRIRHRWAEKAGFLLERPAGMPEYILLHFLTPARIGLHGQAAAVSEGDLIVFSPSEPHWIESDNHLLHDWMHIVGDMDLLMRRYGLCPNTLYHLNLSTTISNMVAYLETEFFAQRSYYADLSRVKLEEMLICAAHNLSGEQPKILVRSEVVEHLREVRAYMLADPNPGWTVDKIAGIVCISKSHLHAVYKYIFGIAPTQDLIQMRIEKAKTLLLQGLSVTAAAEQSGYKNVYHFIRQFRQTTGTTPKQFKK